MKACTICDFFSLYVLKNERKESKTQNNSDLMLETRVVNPKNTPMSSSMRDSKKCLKCIVSLALEFMVMVEFKASNNNQCPTSWFKTQVETIKLK
jgi:hypothetical protein